MTDNPSRRQLLKKGAAGISVLVVGGLVWRAWDNGVFSAGTGPAYEPWLDWQTEQADAPLSLIRAAILASNAHNTQPWLFRATEGRIDIYADLNRNLGAFDPYRRELFISLGCALENLVIAASHAGLSADVTLIPGTLPPAPDSKSVLVATVDLKPGAATRHALYDQIPHRHTNRGAYDPAGQIKPSVITALEQEVSHPALQMALFPRGQQWAKLGGVIVNATQQIVNDHVMAADSAKWFRFDWDDLQKHRDGVTLDAAGLPPLLNIGAKMIPSPSSETSDQQWLGATRDVHVATSAMLGMILVNDLYGREASLIAGRAWQRLHLKATALGLAVQPLNQPVEIVDREYDLGKPPLMAASLAQISGSIDWRPTFVFRLGYAERPARPSPRRAVEDVVLT
ncbi:MAG: Acg family FMN-binding oxidoreductase [Alphaproteobacteria bacterium]